MSAFSQTIRRVVKDASLRTGLYDSTLFNVYPFCFEPKQLVFLTECLRSVAKVPGCFVEAGCWQGATTVFLNKFADNDGIDPRPYFAIDTFAGFAKPDAEYEIKSRGKPTQLREIFLENKKEWFDRTMQLHGIDRVKSIQSDVTKFDFASIPPIAFCLLDVDLYTCTKAVLPKIHCRMSPGGIIVVDDCKTNALFDGAAQAYREFQTERNMPIEIAEEKLGVVRVPL